MSDCPHPLLLSLSSCFSQTESVPEYPSNCEYDTVTVTVTDTLPMHIAELRDAKETTVFTFF